ncbi:hypothetical protein K438DRAFT_571443 [Mycena galopus ATCC 62051]|nr:hypothetical protein K438DRAFT_571443 [Mycena galopus ATCC 62051]
MFSMLPAQSQGQGQPQAKVDKWFRLETPLALSAATPAGELDLYRSLSSPYPYPYPSVSASYSASSSSPPRSPPKSSLSSRPQAPAAAPPSCTPPPAPVSNLSRVRSCSRSGFWGSLVRLAASTRTPSSATGTSDSGSSCAGGGVSDTSRKSSTDSDTNVLPPTMYRNAIPLFHTLLKLLRILPAWRVVCKLTGRKPRKRHRKREWGRETWVTRRRAASS